MEQGKSHRSRGGIAPYRRPVSSSSRHRPGFLSKVKSFFKHSDDIEKNQDFDVKRKYSKSVSGSSVPIPGGFFSADDASSSITLSEFNEGSQIREASSNLDAIRKEENNEGINSDDENAYSADVSNARLAEFFSRKGEEPLSDMEMEGVKSLMLKSNRSSKSSRRGSIVSKDIGHNDSAGIVYSRVLDHSKTPSLAASTMRAPAFTPKYDDSFGSNSLANTSRSSVSSKRRVFDYSSLPSPYKTTVYKYSVADKDISDRHDNTKPIESSPNMVTKPISNKKLSNTASALVSLLDNDSSKNETSNRLANPYSSHVNQIRKYKKSSPASPSTKQETSRTAPLKSSASQELENTKGKVVNETSLKSQSQSSVDKYKPMRSSSLRSNVVKASESPEKITTSKVVEPEVPKVPTFNFQFQAKGPIDVNTKTESPKQSQPQEKPKPDIKSGFTFKRESQNFAWPENNSDNDASDNSSTVAPNINLTSQSVNSVTNTDFQFDFGKIAPSKVDPNTIDEKRVQEFKMLFIF